MYWVLMQDDIRTSYIAGHTRTALRMHLSEFLPCADLVTILIDVILLTQQERMHFIYEKRNFDERAYG